MDDDFAEDEEVSSGSGRAGSGRRSLDSRGTTGAEQRNGPGGRRRRSFDSPEDAARYLRRRAQQNAWAKAKRASLRKSAAELETLSGDKSAATLREAELGSVGEEDPSSSAPGRHPAPPPPHFTGFAFTGVRPFKMNKKLGRFKFPAAAQTAPQPMGTTWGYPPPPCPAHAAAEAPWDDAPLDSEKWSSARSSLDDAAWRAGGRPSLDSNAGPPSGPSSGRPSGRPSFDGLCLGLGIGAPGQEPRPNQGLTQSLTHGLTHGLLSHSFASVSFASSLASTSFRSDASALASGRPSLDSRGRAPPYPPPGQPRLPSPYGSTASLGATCATGATTPAPAGGKGEGAADDGSRGELMTALEAALAGGAGSPRTTASMLAQSASIPELRCALSMLQSLATTAVPPPAPIPISAMGGNFPLAPGQGTHGQGRGKEAGGESWEASNAVPPGGEMDWASLLFAVPPEGLRQGW